MRVKFRNRCGNQRRSEQGVTLIELIVVVVIVGILAAIAWPNFIAQQRRQQLRETNNRLVQLFQETSSQAVSGGKQLTLTFMVNQAAGADLQISEAVSGTVLGVVALENAAQITSVLEAGTPTNQVSFDVRGRPGNNASLVLTTKSAGLTGTVRLLVTGKTVIQ